MESIESIISDGSEILAALPKGDPRIRVALLDGPVDVTHPCLEAAAIQLSDPFEFGRRVGGKATEHGTQIASVIFGQPGTCIEGLAPMCHGISIAIYRDEDSGRIGGTSQLMLASAIESEY
ncbi:hypothetical protein [Nitrosospira sp. NpAV]|uniref:hypothetical protein n=1 Tax=Nitrosospira sp. NpAV TaxID=58133 RepID=UPI00059EE75B|nr:hypothetical protein [Nitrosospira sp. NpAV]KIO50267.1 hypothetical protein SQ11_00750 [Nitrosospira sp. NpAV]